MLVNLEKELNKAGKKLVRDVKRNIKAKKKYASGQLYKSISYELYEKDGNYVLQYFMLDYGYYQDEGVKGANPRKVPNGRQKAPFSQFKFGSNTGRKGGLTKSLDKWIIRKRIAPRDKQGRFMSRKQVKFLIARSIYFTGIEPSNFFSDVWDKMVDKITPQLEKAVLVDYEKIVMQILKK